MFKKLNPKQSAETIQADYKDENAPCFVDKDEIMCPFCEEPKIHISKVKTIIYDKNIIDKMLLAIKQGIDTSNKLKKLYGKTTISKYILYLLEIKKIEREQTKGGHPYYLYKLKKEVSS